jgi:hypothetical protein
MTLSVADGRMPEVPSVPPGFNKVAGQQGDPSHHDSDDASVSQRRAHSNGGVDMMRPRRRHVPLIEATGGPQLVPVVNSRHLWRNEFRETLPHPSNDAAYDHDLATNAPDCARPQRLRQDNLLRFGDDLNVCFLSIIHPVSRNVATAAYRYVSLDMCAMLTS